MSFHVIKLGITMIQINDAILLSQGGQAPGQVRDGRTHRNERMIQNKITSFCLFKIVTIM